MIARLRQLLAPPVFPSDEEKTHAADLLNTALLTILLGTVAYCTIAPIVALLQLESGSESLRRRILPASQQPCVP